MAVKPEKPASRQIIAPYADASPSRYFPQSVVYRQLLEHTTPAIREGTPFRRPFPYSERHLHCIWHDPELRPATLKTRTGETVHVESPGIWNQEAGPDFLGAVLLVGPARRRVAGDVEIHVHPGDWALHGHGKDPRYDQVRFHVTYFPGTAKDIDCATGSLHIVLRDSLSAIPGFHFEHIDTTAYPYAARADLTPCSIALQSCNPAQQMEILRAAGEERLRRKAQRIRLLIEEVGAGQALYEESMVAFGYKHNKAAFRQIARDLPLDELRSLSEGDPDTAYALLMGVAGLLPDGPRAEWSRDAARWVRSLWDRWWRYQDIFSDRSAGPIWRFDGIRPANHPTRRLMAAAHLFTRKPTWEQTLPELITDDSGRATKRIRDDLATLYDPYLSMRWSLTGARREKPTALVGPTLVASLYTNVLIPFCAAIEISPHTLNPLLNQLPAEAKNRILKQTAYYLFGRDHSATLYKSEITRQGLLQIFNDFCLNDRSRCASCVFPDAVNRYRKGMNT